MEAISQLGMFVFSMFTIAVAVEAVLDIFRGVLLRFGVAYFERQYTLEEGIALAKQVVSPADLQTGAAQALRRMAGAAADRLAADRNRIAAAIKNLDDASGEKVIPALDALAARVREALSREEQLRVALIRLLACVLGAIVVAVSRFDVLGSLLLTKTTGTMYLVVNVFLGGVAAAAGSSYWHDQLDRIRSIKQAVASLSDVGQPAGR
jgi:hypothetical protein